MKIGIVADDLTGSMDTGVQFIKYGLGPILCLREGPSEHAQVCIVNTESRGRDSEWARVGTLNAVYTLEGRFLFKKIDSTLRGHLATEIKTLLSVTKYQRAIICPAVIDEGRQVINSELWLHGKPLHETEFALDPDWPARTSSIQQRIGTPSEHIPLAIVRSGPESLKRCLRDSNAEFLIPDAEEESDLQVIAKAIVFTDILPCGALGFARAWASAILGRDSGFSKIESGIEGSILFVVGSYHPRTRQQVNSLIKSHDIISQVIHSNDPNDLADVYKALITESSSGKHILLRTPDDRIEDRVKQKTLIGALAKTTSEIIQAHSIGCLIICGGETAGAIIEELGTKTIEIRGELLPGIPYGILKGGIGAGIYILTKAGGFGNQESLLRLYEKLAL